MKMIKVLFVAVLTVITLIILKSNQSAKEQFYKHVYDSNISFAQINNWYESKFGSSIPFSDYFIETQTVFNEKLVYSDSSAYLDGVKLNVEHNYLVPCLKTGIVIFVGEKENYGNTVIIEQENGIDVWYSNLSEINVKLYDYIDQGTLIGQADNYLYLVFIKEGQVINYEDNI